MQSLARRLRSINQASADPNGHEAAVVIEKLRLTLSQFAGDGFASLLQRAVTLASAEVPSLQRLKVGADGRLEGFAQLAAEIGTDAAREAEVAVVAYLLELLTTFVGEPLTLKLVQGTWPDPAIRK